MRKTGVMMIMTVMRKMRATADDDDVDGMTVVKYVRSRRVGKCTLT